MPFPLYLPARITSIIIVSLLVINSISSQIHITESYIPDELSKAATDIRMGITPTAYGLVEINFAGLRQNIKQEKQKVILRTPEGSEMEFVIRPSQVVSPEVAQLYTIKTFIGHATSDPTILIACDYTDQDFHAAVYNGSKSYFIEPWSTTDRDIHVVYYKKDLPVGQTICHVTDKVQAAVQEQNPQKSFGPDQKTTYRLALGSAGEYSQQFGGSPYDPTNVLNALASGVNLINPIYLRDLGIDFQLVTTTALIWPDPVTDPYDTNDPDQLVNEISEQCHIALTQAGYDVGHLVIWDDLGGLAALDVVCMDHRKGEGYSATSNSVTTLWIDYVCHELGHQFGALHNFSADECFTSVRSFRYEPGEGSSIMSYAGVCGPPVQYAIASDPFFHSASIRAIQSATTFDAGGGCGIVDVGANREDPVAQAGRDITIPKSTPFVLVGAASDGNDPLASLTYTWEQYDSEGTPTIGPPQCSSTDDPLFRFDPPSIDNFRHLPEFGEALAGNNNGVIWEVLPCTERTINFSFFVRDNNESFGRTAIDLMTITVANTGPFEVTSPDGGETLNGGTINTITWSENGTSAHCPTVDILLSTDSGVTWVVIADGVVNDGTEDIQIPNMASGTARLLISCDVTGGFLSSTTFYDVSNNDFSIMPLPGIDMDGDGFPVSVDCDDTNPEVNPGEAEICNGIDDDCDGLIDDVDPDVVGQVTYYADSDGDTYGDPNISITACAQPANYVLDNSDCDDQNNAINTGATEICNGIDDDCDGLIDQADPSLTGSATWYPDTDGDSYGDPTLPLVTCNPPAGYVADNSDCDDTDFGINPGAAEICNGIDDDCDGLIDQADPSLTGGITYFLDNDSDGFGNDNSIVLSCTALTGYVTVGGDCNDNSAAINPGATEICNNIDDDCDGLIDAADPSVVGGSIWYIDADGDGFGNPNSSTLACTAPTGYVSNNLDCNDNSTAINPNATEICNNIDDDCDGLIDQADPDLSGTVVWYTDNDGDGFGDPANSLLACTAPTGYVSNNSDCDDSNPNINPGATEICNNIDDDCDGLIDGADPSLSGGTIWYADADLDGFGDSNTTIMSCTQPFGYVNNQLDCNDMDQNISPSNFETCNGYDDDCDGLIDQADPDIIDLPVWYADLDGDGFGNIQNSLAACAQPTDFVDNALDCNDGSNAISPTAIETCNGIDDDCDGLIDQADPDLQGGQVWFIDADADGYGTELTILTACEQPIGYVANDLDCNDNNSLIHPGAQEICNDLDDDCDGLIDQDDPSVQGAQVWFLDADADGYGSLSSTILSCAQPNGYVANDLDCNDGNVLVNPAAQEICNNLDDDCDGLIDTADPDLISEQVWYLDADNDGYGTPMTISTLCNRPTGYVDNNLDCNDNDAAVNPQATEICNNNIDDDCNGLTDDADPNVQGLSVWYADTDGDGFGDINNTIMACTTPVGYSANNTDCNDNSASAYPGATELCNGQDDDCDGLVDGDDPDVGGNATWYIDNDGDGFGNGDVSIESCEEPAGYVLDNTDCNDDDPQVNPNAQEVCNSKDDDCDGLIDISDPDIAGVGLWFADEDNDGYGDVNVTIEECVQPIGYVPNNEDCNDQDADINPEAEEICNDIDDNCDGLIDEDDPGLENLTAWYIDADGDGYGDEDTSVSACFQPSGFSEFGSDCDDMDPNINPGADDIPDNGIDEDCDGVDGTSATTNLADLGLSLFPNPSLGTIYLGGDLPRIDRLELMDLQGRLVFQKTKVVVPARLDLDELPAGTYLIKIEAQQNITVQKIILLD